jgi:hypothetical protein
MITGSQSGDGDLSTRGAGRGSSGEGEVIEKPEKFEILF